MNTQRLNKIIQRRGFEKPNKVNKNYTKPLQNSFNEKAITKPKLKDFKNVKRFDGTTV